jgi:hypothetical protein
MGRGAHRRVLPLELLLVSDVDHPVADDEEGEGGGEDDPRCPVDVRDTVYVSLDPLAVFAATVRRFPLAPLPGPKLLALLLGLPMDFSMGIRVVGNVESIPMLRSCACNFPFLCARLTRLSQRR